MAVERLKITSCTIAEFYAELDCRLRRLKYMNLKRWKIIQNLIISGLVTWLAIEAGADPNVTIIIIALINGVSMADIAALWGASVEVSLEPGEETVSVERSDEIEAAREIDEGGER